MVALLSASRRAVAVGASVFLSSGLVAQENDRHQFEIAADFGYVDTSSNLGPWPEGGLGKLRYGEDGGAMVGERLFVDYQGRIGPTLSVHAVADFVDDGAQEIGVTEAYLRLRPVPKSLNQQQWRFGVFYPPFSFENPESGWRSPYTISFSAINTWLGEEIRPAGAEWSLRRRLDQGLSPHELRAFASVFYGGDPSGTLLFWRGWSLHDRQTRWNERVEMPSFPLFGTDQFEPQSVEPLAEIDSRPGYYLGMQWSYGQRLSVQLAHYDNRADFNAFRDGQWGWRTAFDHLAIQASLPGDFGLIAQWMGGATDWIAGARPSGDIYGSGPHVRDHFGSRFLLLTRALRGKHRVSLRMDEFDIWRRNSAFVPEPDKGKALTVAYRYTANSRFDAAVEWLEIESSRDLWSNWYDVDRTAKEHQLRLQLNVHLLD